jgi:hypothetical protein
MHNVRYAYLVGGLMYLFIWVLLYIIRSDLRKQMMYLSVITMPLGISEPIFRRDYWNPPLFNGWPIGLEELIFCFAIGGIAAVLYEEIFRKRYSRVPAKTHAHSLLAILLFFVVWSYVLIFRLGVNSIYACSAALLIVAIYLVSPRKDLVKVALLSGLLVSLLMLAFYQLLLRIYPDMVREIWYLKNISGILVLGIPIEELMWGFCWGFFAGPLYEIIHGLRLKNYKQRSSKPQKASLAVGATRR